MKIEFKENCLPVLGWVDMSSNAFNEYLANEVIDGEDVIFNTYKKFKEDELCVFLLYKDYSKKRIYRAMSGTAKYLGLYPDHTAMLTYAFHPSSVIKVNGIKSCAHCGIPEIAVLKTKKL
jgi:hypothetical protein